MINFLENSSDADMVYSDYFDFSEGEERTLKALPEIETVERWNCVGACFMYRKAVYDEIGEYDPDLRLAEDYDYWLRVYKKFKIGHLKKPLYLYQRHSGSLYSKYFYSVRIMDVFTRLKNGFLTPALALNEFTFIVISRLKGKENMKKYHFGLWDKRVFNLKVKRVIAAVLKGRISFTDAKDRLFSYIAEKEFSTKRVKR